MVIHHMVKPVRKLLRPDHSPSGYEWLCDAFNREGGNNDVHVRERVRSALAESEITAILRTQSGDRYDIPQRMWDKEPVQHKVYKRFSDGRMRMHLGDSDSPSAEGWIFIPVGSLKKIIATPETGAPAGRGFSPAKLKRWYLEFIKLQCEAGLIPSREEELAAARKEFSPGVSRNAMRDLRRTLAPEGWKRSGRRKTSNN